MYMSVHHNTITDFKLFIMQTQLHFYTSILKSLVFENALGDL